jgi:hypothetical protein
LTKALAYEAHARHASYQKGYSFPNKNVWVTLLTVSSLAFTDLHASGV